MKNSILLRFKLPLAALSFLLLACLTISVQAQSGKAAAPQPAPEEKAEQILQRAVEALGGSNYLNVRTVTSRGLFTRYLEGQPNLVSSFVDYTVFPDKERTEFKTDGIKTIQTNVGETGWIFDGAVKSVRDMKPAQVADFKLSQRTNVDNLLRGGWRRDGAKIAYAGRREAGVGRRNEAVRVTYPDGFVVEFEFGALDHIPAKMVFIKKNPDNGEESKEEDRFAQYVTLDGILAPLVIDHFLAGVQTSRINYQTIEFNTQIADSIFARPANAKAVK